MIIEEDKDMDLGLAVSYPDQYVRTRLDTTTSGAGTNADPRINMAFVTSDPLSELVWSPHRGLSLKCAECSLTEKSPSSLWDVGPSKLALSPTHSIRSRGTNDDNSISERKLTAPDDEFHADSEAAKGDAYLAKSPRRCAGPFFGSSAAHHSGTGGNLEEVKPAEQESVVHFNQTQECNNKEKALCSSKGIQFQDIAKDEDDSHYSGESCNNASLFSKGKRRWSFEQQFIVGSKRIKRQIHEASTATSLVKQDSSFLNWISNMVKGFAKSNQYECPLARNLNHPDHGPESYDQKNITCDKTHEFGSGNTGFQSIFQSLYCPNPKLSITRMSNADYPISSAKELVEAEKTYISITPISFFRENDERRWCLSTKLSSQPQIVFSNIASPQETCKTNSSENKNLSSLACIKEKDEVCTSDTFLGKKNILSAEDNSLHSLSEGKTITDDGNKKDPLRSSWITRIYSKTPRHVLNSDCCSSTHVMLEHSAGCTMDSPQNHINSSLHQKKSHDAPEESPCLCIKCFQLGHWAIACPISSSSRQRQSDNNTPVVNHCNAGTVQLQKSSEPYSSMFVAKEIRSQVAAENSTCNRKKPQMEIDLMFSPIPEGKLVSDTEVFCLDEVQNHISPSYKEVELKENQIPPLCNSASKHISDAANIFDVLRGLHLSRRDILKWMNSHMSLSRLDGFFLRLRLRNWGKGLGGTGYYVACINETRREKTSKGSKNSIYVSIGGIKCLVESQYVSNHKFSVDELMAWWQTMSRSGELPTKEYMRSKLEERKKLGF